MNLKFFCKSLLCLETFREISKEDNLFHMGLRNVLFKRLQITLFLSRNAHEHTYSSLGKLIGFGFLLFPHRDYNALCICIKCFFIYLKWPFPFSFTMLQREREGTGNDGEMLETVFKNALFTWAPQRNLLVHACLLTGKP